MSREIKHYIYKELMEADGVLNVTGLSQKQARELIQQRNWRGKVATHTGSPISLDGKNYGINAYLVCNSLQELLFHTDGDL